MVGTDYSDECDTCPEMYDEAGGPACPCRKCPDSRRYGCFEPDNNWCYEHDCPIRLTKC